MLGTGQEEGRNTIRIVVVIEGQSPKAGGREAEGMRWGWGAHSLLSLRFKGEQVAAYNSGSSLLSTLGLVGTSPPRPSLQTWRFHSLTVG